MTNLRVKLHQKNVGSIGDFSTWTAQKRIFKFFGLEFWVDITKPNRDKEKLEKYINGLISIS